MNELSQAEVNAWRLARHHLDRRAPKSKLADVVGDIGAVQAQVMSAAELQIAVRVDCHVEEVRDALWKQRTLVKTWLMRGTLHLARSSDLPIFTAAMSKRWIRPNNAWLKFFNLQEAEVLELTDEIGDALSDTPQTREELIAIVADGRPERFKEALRSGWGMLKPAARNGRLCFGPNRGQSVTFVSPRAWLADWRETDPETAFIEMARRYVHTYGPANKDDFAYWWGNWPGVAAAAWKGLRDELAPVSVEGRNGFVLRGDLGRFGTDDRAGTPNVRLLPNFDPYLMGHADRDHLFDRVHRPKVSRTAGWISPVILVDGRVLGVWSYVLAAKKRLRVELTPFAKLTRAIVTGASDRAEELAQALDAKLERVAVS